MGKLSTVKVSRKNQISVPSEARRRLNIQGGDHLLVDIQDGMIILIPQPGDYAAQMAGLHREVWDGINTSAYLDEERESWEDLAEN